MGEGDEPAIYSRQFYVNQITGQRQAEQRHENSDEIDDETSRLERSGFQLSTRPAVAKQAGECQ